MLTISKRLTNAEKINLIRSAHQARPTIPATKITPSKKAYDRNAEKRETRNAMKAVYY